jgi:hypothetical protein
LYIDVLQVRHGCLSTTFARALAPFGKMTA